MCEDKPTSFLHNKILLFWSGSLSSFSIQYLFCTILIRKNFFLKKRYKWYLTKCFFVQVPYKLHQIICLS